MIIANDDHHAHTIFVNLFNDLSQCRRLHFHSHHSQDSTNLETNILNIQKDKCGDADAKRKANKNKIYWQPGQQGWHLPRRRTRQSTF